MFNKNLIVGAVIVLLLGGGIFAYLFSGNTTSDKSVGLTGKKELTREVAAELILENLKKNGSGVKMSPYLFIDQNKKAYDEFHVHGSAFDSKYLSIYESAGLVITSRDAQYQNLIYFTLTDKGKQYANINESMTLVKLAEVKSIEVTGLTEPSPQGVLATYTMKFQSTPFGELYEKNKTDWKPSEAKPSDDQDSQALLMLYDDGWRVQ